MTFKVHPRDLRPGGKAKVAWVATTGEPAEVHLLVRIRQNDNGWSEWNPWPRDSPYDPKRDEDYVCLMWDTEFQLYVTWEDGIIELVGPFRVNVDGEPLVPIV